MKRVRPAGFIDPQINVVIERSNRYQYNEKVTAYAILPNGGVDEIPHLVYHSPDGFEFGYEGSGPSDLSRSIVGYLMRVQEPNSLIYHRVKTALIAPLQGDGPHTISARAFIDVIRQVEAAIAENERVNKGE